MQQITACPVCGGQTFSHYISCKDYTVSHETFQLMKCANCNFVFTNPQPEQKDLGKYYLSASYISHANKSLNVIDTVYKISRKFTLKWKYNIVKRNSTFSNTNPSVLDYGCGTGEFLHQCQKNNIITAGVEPSKIARTMALQHYGGKIVPNIQDLSGEFNAITLWHVLEHVAELNETVQKLRSLLKENGTMFIAVPNLNSPDAQNYQSFWAGFDVPRHLWHFSVNTMEKLFTKHKLRLIKVKPMPLDAYYVSILSEKYKTGSISLSTITRAAIQGWKSNKQAKTTNAYSSLIYIAQK